MTTATGNAGADHYAWQWRLALLAGIWGSSFVLIKVALAGYPPLAIAAIRIVLGAVTLIVAARVLGQRLPRSRIAWFHAGVAGIIANAVPFTLVGIGIEHTTSVLAGIWNATTPLVVLVVSVVVLRTERATARRVGGFLVGFGGVVVLLGAWRGGIQGDAVGNACLGATALCYGIATPYMQRTLAPRPEGTVALAAAQMLCAAVAMVVAVPFAPAASRSVEVSAGATLAVVSLGIVATGCAYLLFTSLVRGAGASIAASVTYLMPVVTLTLGALVLGETVRWNEPVGGVVVLAGVAIATTRRRGMRARPHPP